MSMIAARLDEASTKEFELLAKTQHKTRSKLLKELIVEYLQKNKVNLYIKAAQNIAKHEKNYPEEYSDIYNLGHDWE